MFRSDYLLAAFIMILLVAPLLASSISYADEPVNFYVKYLFKLNVSSTDYSTYVEANLVYNATLYDDRVEVTTSVEKLFLSTREMNTTTTTTIVPGEGNIPKDKFTYSTTIDLERYYNTSIMGGETLGLMSGLISFDLGGLVYYYNITYQGRDTYKDLPVYKYAVILRYSGMNVNLTGRGETYLYTGTLQPLYMRMDMNFTSTVSKGIFNYELETIETNLPRSAQVLELNIGDKVVVVAGGLPGAKISVSGTKGTDTLKIKNQGDKPGYAVILFKNKTLSLSSIPARSSVARDFKIIGLKPGEEKTVELGFVLDKDINEESQTVSSGIDWGLVILLSITAAIIGALVYLLHKAISHIRKE